MDTRAPVRRSALGRLANGAEVAAVLVLAYFLLATVHSRLYPAPPAPPVHHHAAAPAAAPPAAAVAAGAPPGLQLHDLRAGDPISAFGAFASVPAALSVEECQALSAAAGRGASRFKNVQVRFAGRVASSLRCRLFGMTRAARQTGLGRIAQLPRDQHVTVFEKLEQLVHATNEAVWQFEDIDDHAESMQVVVRSPTADAAPLRV